MTNDLQQQQIRFLFPFFSFFKYVSSDKASAFGRCSHRNRTEFIYLTSFDDIKNEEKIIDKNWHKSSVRCVSSRSSVNWFIEETKTILYADIRHRIRSIDTPRQRVNCFLWFYLLDAHKRINSFIDKLRHTRGTRHTHAGNIWMNVGLWLASHGMRAAIWFKSKIECIYFCHVFVYWFSSLWPFHVRDYVVR